MKCYWIINKKHYKKYRAKTKILGSDFKYVNMEYGKNFEDSYKWLNNQIKNQNRKAPIFCYSQKPDFRKYEFKNWTNKKDMILLVIKYNKEDVKYTDFNLWHFVLNKVYLPKNNKDDKIFWKYINNKYKKSYVFFEEMDRKDQRKVIKSWDKIFSGKKDQLIFTEIKKEQIIKEIIL